MTAAMARAEVSWSQVSGIGLAAQTETFVVWERATGRPVYPAISWRDTRAGDVCDRLRTGGHAAEIRRRSGLPLQPAFTAPKLRWLLDTIDSGQRRAVAGDLLFGDVNCWLTWNLSGRVAHVTEPSMASRTMLFNLADQAWDPDLLALFGIPGQLLPEVHPTAGKASAETDRRGNASGGSAVICASAGDQQAALFGQRCWETGQAKLTLGTGAFLWCQAGPVPPAQQPDGVVSTCAWQLNDEAAFALEGFVPTAGSVTPWLRRLGALGNDAWPAIRATALARAARAGRGGLWCIPALYGLGTPEWTGTAAADISGLTASSTAADISELQAALIGVAHQVSDAVDAAVRAGLPEALTTIHVDGGMSANDSLLQALADLSGSRLERGRTAEATALGAGALAGLGAGVWDRASLDDLLAAAAGPATVIEPQLPAGDRVAVRGTWREVRDRAVAGWTARSPHRPGPT